MRNLVCVAVLVSGCMSYVRPLAQLPLKSGAPVGSQTRNGKNILILPFDDERGPEYARVSPDNYVPVANWFHTRRYAFYPEQASLLRTREHHRTIVTVGSLAHAFPSLIAAEMSQMGMPDHVAIDSHAGPADYIISGRVKRTELVRDASPALMALAPFGVPSAFFAHDLEYEVDVYDARDRTTPILTRTYHWRGTITHGLYYGHDAPERLFARSLEATLPQVVHDLEAMLATRA